MDHGPPRPVVLSLRGCRSPGVARHTGMPRRKDHGPPRRVVLWAFEFHCTARDPLRCRQCAIFFYKKILHLQSQLLLCLLSKKKLQSILLEWHFKSCLKARLHRFKTTVYFAQHSATEEGAGVFPEQGLLRGEPVRLPGWRRLRSKGEVTAEHEGFRARGADDDSPVQRMFE